MIAFDRANGERSTPIASMTSDELTDVLLRMGARLVASQANGNFLAIRYRLVFVRTATVVGQRELSDVLRAAATTPARLRELLGEARASASSIRAHGSTQPPIPPATHMTERRT
jgi:hypothetical protein